MNRKKLKKTLIGIGKDVLIAFTIVCIVMLALFAYCGIWPPMVVVESGSMQRHNDRSMIGVIDTGDMVFVKSVGGVDDVVTYVEGEATDYSRYGTFGDVVVFRPNGLSVREDGSTVIPIIHRLVVWIDVNETMVDPDFQGTDYANITFDVPSLEMFGTKDTIVRSNYGYHQQNITINLSGLLKYYELSHEAPHGGYITMGDNNAPFYDQHPVGPYVPVLPEWIVGRAVGEIPWFGLIKLGVTGASLDGVPKNSWTGLYTTVFLLLFLPFMVDMLGPRFSRWKKARDDTAKEEGKGVAENLKNRDEPPPGSGKDKARVEDVAGNVKKEEVPPPEPEKDRESGEVPLK